MDAAGFASAHLVGNPLGGWIALEPAKRGRARTVVALSPAGGCTNGSPQEKRISRSIRMGHALDRWAAPRSSWRASRARGGVRDLEQVTCPVLIAWAGKDRILPPSPYRAPFDEQLPHAERTVMADVGHVAMWDDPALVADVVADFAARHAVTTTA
jgi:pimeloyl-ACP methyl ester carboxylesterase